MGPLICCVEDSDGARGALRVSHTLAERLGLELVLVHVAPPTEAPGVSAALAGQQRLREEELRDAAELLERVAGEEGLDPDVRRIADVGPAASRIVAICEQEEAELVVIGSRGRAGLRAAMLGSVSSQVAVHAPCPCLVVPPAAWQRPFLA